MQEDPAPTRARLANRVATARICKSKCYVSKAGLRLTEPMQALYSAVSSNMAAATHTRVEETDTQSDEDGQRQQHRWTDRVRCIGSDER